MLEEVERLVFELLVNDTSGHDPNHIRRVSDLAMKFAATEECNKDIVLLTALLHDVDDYKLVGNEKAKELSNTRRILDSVEISDNLKQQVITNVKTIGYSKLLNGIRPKSIEGWIVSDADMCDAIGANGILRVYAYSYNNDRPFFDKNVWPIENMDAKKYTRKVADSSVCHIFEKVLKLKNLMLTKSGQEEGIKRHEIVVQFLYNLFSEENALEWIDYLTEYLIKEDTNKVLLK